MNNTKATLKYKDNYFEVIKTGDHVICAVSKKKILLNELRYWNTELQEAYYSPVEVKIRLDKLKEK